MAFQVPPSAQKILSRTDLERKINRMSYQLMEILYGKSNAVLIGIEDGGFQLAGLLAMKMQTIDDIRLELASLYVNKPAPYSEQPFIRQPTDALIHQPVILIDDVGNSGSTLFHALSAVYPLQPESLYVALLIDRTHKRFPIKADIVGLELATTLTEHIHVVFDEKGVPDGAYLF